MTPPTTDGEIDKMMPRITLTVGDGEVVVYVNDVQLFKTPTDKEITLSGIPIHKATETAIQQHIQKAVLEARIDELELAVQQYIHTTKSNPNNFSDYAHHRIKVLTTAKEQRNDGRE